MIVAVLALLASLVCFPEVAREAVRDGLALCVETVLPSLFPFFVVSSLAVQCDAALARPLARFMWPLFGVGGAGAGAFALGLLGGYPTGARAVAELYARGAVGREEAERLLALCNNSGPAFFLGVCAAAFGSVRAGAYLYLVHVLAAMLVGVATRREVAVARGDAVSANARGAVSLPAAVEGAAASCVSVGANVVAFLVVLRLAARILPLASLGALSRAALFGFVELTNGIAVLPPTRAGFALCAAIMGWGGLSVQAQTLAVVSPVGLSLRREVRGKVLHAAVSAALAWGIAPWVL